MYFTPGPKTEKKDLFGTDYALNLFLDYLQDSSTRMVVIKGLRRVGKTSLLNVGLREAGLPHLKIDVRESPYHSKTEFLAFFVKALQQQVGASFWQALLKNISGVSLGYKDLSATVFFSQEQNFSLFLSRLNEQLGKKKEKFILALDEAHLLKPIEFDYLLASIFDNYSNIKLVLTGSEIGLLDSFIGKKDYKAPLFGRIYGEIELRRLEPELSQRFLESGFQQIHKTIAFEEVRQVIGRLDGILGWLSPYGWLRSKDINHALALEKVEEQGQEIVRREMQLFLEKRKAAEKFYKVLRNLAQGNARWNILKAALRKERIPITDAQLDFYLKELIDYGFIEKKTEGYQIPDPLLVKALLG